MSSDVSIIFTYNGVQTTIQGKKTDIMKNIFEKYIIKINLDNTKNYYYLYNGDKINEELKYEELVNEIDKEGNEMRILVIETNTIDNNENMKEINEIICPKCGENLLIKIEDYKLNLYKCNKCINNHNIDEKYEKDNIIFINELNNLIKVDLTKIKCNECKENNKGNTYKNEFYKCLTCNNNLCPLCKSKHNKDHIIVEYDKRNVVCNEHNDFYVKYCNECNKNICFKCEKEHKNHNLIYYGDIISNNENNNENNNQEFRKYKDILDNVIDNLIDNIVQKLKTIKESMRIYYNVSNKLINNNNRNYEILKNISEFKNNNNKIINDIKEIINDKNINN